jgi:hypothetical protein
MGILSRGNLEKQKTGGGRPPDKWSKKPKACKCPAYRLSTSADFFAGYSSAYRASAQVYVVAIICQELQPLQWQ